MRYTFCPPRRYTPPPPFTEEARRSVPGLHVFYVTGNPERVLAGRSAPRPGECVLGKPFNTAELVAAVRNLVASSAGSA